MGQARHLFVYFHSFLIIIPIQIEKSIDGVLGIQTRGLRMVGADETTELWRPPITSLLGMHENPFLFKSLLTWILQQIILSRIDHNAAYGSTLVAVGLTYLPNYERTMTLPIVTSQNLWSMGRNLKTGLFWAGSRCLMNCCYCTRTSDRFEQNRLGHKKFTLTGI